MAQGKINDFAKNLSKGGPPGLGIGLKVLAVGAAAAYGISQSMYTGDYRFNGVQMWKSTAWGRVIIAKSGSCVV